MNQDQWNRKYVDTHAGLAVIEALSGPKSTIAYEPGDKNAKDVTRLKRPIEAEELAKRNKVVDNFVLDTIDLRAKDILDVKYEKLLEMAIKARPKVVEGKMEHTYTFRDMVTSATNFEKDLKRQEEERRNTLDAEFKADSTPQAS